MKNSHQEIVTLYKEHELTSEEIAGALGIEEYYVKGILMQYSKEYRDSIDHPLKEAKKNKSIVSDSEFEEFCEEYKALARTTEDEHLKEKTLRRLMDEYKGRLDIKKEVDNGRKTVININMFNDALEAARKQNEKLVGNLIETKALSN